MKSRVKQWYCTMDSDEFETELRQIVKEARENSISLVGSYDVCMQEADNRNYQIEITEVASQTPVRTSSTD